MNEQKMREALERAQQDINWMLNSRQFLDGNVFDYIDEALAAPAGEQVGLTDAREGYVLMGKTRLQKALLEATIGLIQGLATQLEMLKRIKELEETIAAHEAKRNGGAA